MSRAGLLLVNVLVVATCGLVYELLAGTVASYLYGNAVLEFSLVLGLYLAALGVGAWVSRLFAADLARRFLQVELAVAVLGGLFVPLALYGFAKVAWFRALFDAGLVAVGVLVGVELPLLMRLLKAEISFKEVVARALGLDYAGALVASLAFPLLLVPHLGLVRSGALCGLLNAGLALGGTWWMKPWLRPDRGLGVLRAGGVAVIAVLATLLVGDPAGVVSSAD